MARVISIEIGQALTKICVMNYKEKNPKVQKSITIETPQGVIADGMLNPRESFVQLLRDTFDNNKIREKKLVFTIASNKIASREVTIPYVKESRIGEVLHANAEEYFPVDLSDYRIAHTVLGVLGQGKERSYKVLVMAVPETLLQGYFDVARMLGMEIAAIDYMGNSLLQATKRSCQEGTNMVVKIDGYSTMLMVISDGVMTSFRSIPYGVNEVVRAVQKGNNSTYIEAVTELQEHTYIGNSQWEGIVDLEALEDMNSSLEMLVNGISRVVDFHNSKPENTNIERVMLTGFGGSFGGMSVLVQERLGLFTVPLGNVEGLTVHKDFVENALGNYVGCIGAGMNPLDLVTVFKAKKGKQAAGSGDNVVLPLAIAAGGVVVAGVLAVMGWVPRNQAQQEKAKLERQVNTLLPAETAHNQYVATQQLWENVRSMYGLTVNQNDQLVEFIEELEEKMPSEILVLSLSSTAGGVTLNVEVSDKNAAALVLQQLRDFNSIAIVDTTVVTETISDTGAHTVSFTVNCIYNNLVKAQLDQEKATIFETEEAAEQEE
ncbi:MAG: pilus assembly protein PilM [Lachnospiraceae bacterium]|nr:pilus assembly protein PilM [Lachnospiraceae bacterium]